MLNLQRRDHSHALKKGHSAFFVQGIVAGVAGAVIGLFLSPTPGEGLKLSKSDYIIIGAAGLRTALALEAAEASVECINKLAQPLHRALIRAVCRRGKPSQSLEPSALFIRTAGKLSLLGCRIPAVGQRAPPRMARATIAPGRSRWSARRPGLSCCCEFRRRTGGCTPCPWRVPCSRSSCCRRRHHRAPRRSRGDSACSR